MTETLAYMNDVLEKVCAHLVNNNEDGLASEQDSFIYQFGVPRRYAYRGVYLGAANTGTLPNIFYPVSGFTT